MAKKKSSTGGKKASSPTKTISTLGVVVGFLFIVAGLFSSEGTALPEKMTCHLERIFTETTVRKIIIAPTDRFSESPKLNPEERVRWRALKNKHGRDYVVLINGTKQIGPNSGVIDGPLYAVQFKSTIGEPIEILIIIEAAPC